MYGIISHIACIYFNHERLFLVLSNNRIQLLNNSSKSLFSRYISEIFPFKSFNLNLRLSYSNYLSILCKYTLKPLYRRSIFINFWLFCNNELFLVLSGKRIQLLDNSLKGPLIIFLWSDPCVQLLQNIFQNYQKLDLTYVHTF